MVGKKSKTMPNFPDSQRLIRITEIAATKDKETFDCLSLQDKKILLICFQIMNGNMRNSEKYVKLQLNTKLVELQEHVETYPLPYMLTQIKIKKTFKDHFYSLRLNWAIHRYHKKYPKKIRDEDHVARLQRDYSFHCKKSSCFP